MTDETLSFDEGHASAGPATCSRCETALTEYWGVDGAVLCERCKDEVLEERSAPAGSTARVAKALLFGLGGMAAGAAVWYLVAKMSGYEVGLIAILLGYLVGKGIYLGSEKRGGLGYQLMAVAITYLGIGAGMAPLVYQEFAASKQVEADSAVQAAIPVSELSDSALEAELATLDSAIASSKEAEAEALPAGAAVAVGVVAIILLVLSLPVLSIASGGSVISLFIYGLALYEAFKLTRKVEPQVSGPHAVGAAPA